MAKPPCIAGIDEAGRGALAGPVVAGACILTVPVALRKNARQRWSPSDCDCIIADSKALTPEEREDSYAWITSRCAWGFGMSSAQDIERFGILWANERAMQQALAMLQESASPTELLVDGRDHFRFSLPHRSIVRGDASEPCIAAASIVAKVTRDRLMRDMEQTYPGYGFAGHKGYGTAEHILRIQTLGPCAIHRRTFLSRIVPGQASLTLV